MVIITSSGIFSSLYATGIACLKVTRLLFRGSKANTKAFPFTTNRHLLPVYSVTVGPMKFSNRTRYYLLL
jgi:hypothetical protein